MEERDRITFWLKEFDRAESRKQDRQPVIDIVREFYRDEHWGPNSQAARAASLDQERKLPKLGLNYVFSTCEQCVALMTDQRPGVTAYPREEYAVDKCELVSARLEYDQEAIGLATQAPLVARSMVLEGLGVVRPDWDWTQDYPYGGPALYVLPWETYFFDPDGRDWVRRRDFRWIGEKEWMPLWQIRANWPETSKGLETKQEGQGGFMSTVTAAVLNRIIDAGGRQLGGDRGPGATVYKLWYLDVPEEGLDDWEPPTGAGGLRLPLRLRHMVFTQTRILYDDDWGTRFPHITIPNYIATDPEKGYWPIGDAEMLIAPQRVVNVLASRGSAWGRLVPRTTLLYDKDKVKGEISNPEAVTIGVSGNPNNVLNWQAGSDLGAGFFKLWEMMLQAFETISGIREVLMGRAPEQGESGVAFERLQNFALARVREKMVNFNAGLVTLGERLLELDARHILEQRSIRVPGRGQVVAEGQPGQVVPFTFETIGPELYFKPVREGDTLALDAERNIVVSQPSPEAVALARQAGMEPPRPEPAPTIEYEIKLEATSLAGTRQQKREDALALHDREAIDEEELLKAFDYANWQQVQERMMLRAQQAAQQQAVGMGFKATQGG